METIGKDHSPSVGADGSIVLEGILTLFGFPSTPAKVQALPRSLRWRTTRALLFALGALLLAPVLGMIPPHAPWVVGVVGFGGFMALRKWKERFTVEWLDGVCPKCRGALTLRKLTPLRTALSIPCDGCHHDSRLVVGLPS